MSTPGEQKVNLLDLMFREVEEHEAPHLHAAIAELSEKAGIKKPTILFVNELEGNLQTYLLNRNAAAINLGKPCVIIGEKFREALGHHSPSAPVGDELKAWLAHELGHHKHNDVHPGKFMFMRGAPLWAPLVGAGAVWYSEYLRAKQMQAERDGMTSEQAKDHIRQDWEKSDQLAHPALDPLMKDITTVAKMAAGALLGFAAGATMFALHGRHVEFRADRVSAELMGSGEPLIRGFEMLRAEYKNIPHDPEMVAKYKRQSPIVQFLNRLTHPSDEERIARLKNWTPSR